MTKEEFLAIATEKYEALQKLNEQTSFYDYERGFDELWIDLGRQVLESNIGKVPTDHRKKTSYEVVTGK
jgi:uncharacterized membrane protein